MIEGSAMHNLAGARDKQANGGQKLHALTSLRFFAALFVVVYHTFFVSPPLTTDPRLITRIFSLGFLSVGFFFALSGYILGTVYLRRQGQMRKKDFFIARIARIYPLYLATMLADSPVLFVHLQRQYGVAVACRRFGLVVVTNMLMLQAWIPSLRGLDNPNWSISVEAVFYLLFPFLGTLLWKLEGGWLWLTALIVWIGNQMLVYFVSPYVPLNVLKFNPLLHLGTFAMGILLARWQATRAEVAPLAHWNIGRSIIAVLLALGGCVVFVELLPILPFGNVHDGLLTPVFLLIIGVFSRNGTFIAKLLSAQWLVVLGEASFGLYLLHAVMQHMFERILPGWMQSAYPVYLIACIVLSVASFYRFETPLRRLVITRMKARPRETSEVASDSQ